MNEISNLQMIEFYFFKLSEKFSLKQKWQKKDIVKNHAVKCSSNFLFYIKGHFFLCVNVFVSLCSK